MRVRVGCEFGWETDAPVPMFMLVRPRMDAEHIAVYESKWIEPSEIPLHEYHDLFGNICWRFVAPPGLTTVRYDAVVEIPETADPVVPHAALHPVEDLPDEAIVFTLPSRYVESDQLLDDAWTLFGDTPPTWARIQAVCDWVHHNIEFHTWFEAYVGGRWYTFDARHNTPRIGRVVIGRGRDAVDCALSTAFGSARLAKFVVWSDEITAERPGGPPTEEDADRQEAAARTKQ